MRKDKNHQNHRQHTSEGWRGSVVLCLTAVVVADERRSLRFCWPIYSISSSASPFTPFTCLRPFRSPLFDSRFSPLYLYLFLLYLFLSKTFQLSRQQPTFVCLKPFWQRALCTSASNTVGRRSGGKGVAGERITSSG